MKLTSWRPIYNFNDGIDETIDWFSDIKNQKKYNPNKYTI